MAPRAPDTNFIDVGTERMSERLSVGLAAKGTQESGEPGAEPGERFP